MGKSPLPPQNRELPKSPVVSHSDATTYFLTQSSCSVALRCDTPAPLHPCTPAPLHPCTPAPLHPCTPLIIPLSDRYHTAIKPLSNRFVNRYARDMSAICQGYDSDMTGRFGCRSELNVKSVISEKAGIQFPPSFQRRLESSSF